MPHWIIETNWINREMLKGINEHYRSLKQACESIDEVKFIGLYKPLNDPWNYTSFIRVEKLDKWRDVDNEIIRLYPDFNYNVTCSMSRIYQGYDAGKQPPPIKDLESLKYLVTELIVARGVSVGIREYYLQRCEQFEGKEGAGLLGIYMPYNEHCNWALIKLFDSIRRYMDTGIELQRLHARIPDITSNLDRAYERYEPSRAKSTQEIPHSE